MKLGSQKKIKKSINFTKLFFKSKLNSYPKKKLAKNIKIYIERTPQINPSSFYFKYLKYLFHKLNGNSYPFILKIDLTNKCNLKCIGCYNTKNSKTLSKENIFKLVDNFKYGRIELLGGEPLVHPDIIEIIQYIKSKGLTCTLFSNATLATPNLSQKLKEAGLDYAIITLVSDLPEQHNKVTQSSSWNKTVEGIKNLSKVGIKTFTHTVINNENYKRVKEINRFSKSIGSSALYFKYIAQSIDDPLTIKDNKIWAEVKNWILYEKSPNHGKLIRNMMLLTERNCPGGYSMLSIKANGDVIPCPFIQNEIILGNIKKQNLNQIIKHSKNNKELKEFISPGANCKGCSIEHLCKGGCKGANKNLYNTYDKKDYQCLGPFKKKPTNEEMCDCIPYFW